MCSRRRTVNRVDVPPAHPLGPLAQLAEHRTFNPQVVGSNPTGPYLVVRPSGAKSWLQRVAIDGRRRDLGLGRFPAVSLAMARERAADTMTAVAEGRDPRAERIGPGLPTFRQTAELHVEAYRGRWRNARAVSIFNNRLERYVFPTFGAKRVDRITQADVLSVLTPIWGTKHETARRVRQQVRAVFAYAMAHGHIQINPAGELIDAALPAMPALKQHFRALPYQGIPAALAAVEDSGASIASAACFQFLVLTAARSGEARAARWDEIDFDSATWTVSAERMKAGREHRVPLSSQALELLRRVWPLTGRFRASVPVREETRPPTVGYDADETTPRPWTSRPRDRARIPYRVQNVVHGTNRNPVGRG